MDRLAKQRTLAAVERELTALQAQYEPAMSAFKFDEANALQRKITVLEEERRALAADLPARPSAPEPPVGQEFLAKLEGLLQFLIPQYRAEGKSYLTVSIGCTGGRHRSVAIAAAMARRYEGSGYDVSVTHRDVGSAPEPRREGGPATPMAAAG